MVDRTLKSLTTTTSTVFLPSPLTLSVLSFFLIMVHSPDCFPKKSQTFFIKHKAFLGGLLLRSW